MSNKLVKIREIRISTAGFRGISLSFPNFSGILVLSWANIYIITIFIVGDGIT